MAGCSADLQQGGAMELERTPSPSSALSTVSTPCRGQRSGERDIAGDSLSGRFEGSNQDVPEGGQCGNSGETGARYRKTKGHASRRNPLNFLAPRPGLESAEDSATNFLDRQARVGSRAQALEIIAGRTFETRCASRMIVGEASAHRPRAPRSPDARPPPKALGVSPLPSEESRTTLRRQAT